MTIRLKLLDLQTLIEEAATFTSTDASLPISGVLFERSGDHLIAVSTDRFRLCVSRIDAEFEAGREHAPFVLARPELQSLRAAVKVARSALRTLHARKSAVVELSTVGTGLVVELPASSFTAATASPADWPDWRALFQRYTYGNVRTQAKTNASYLADFRKPARDKANAMLIEFADAKDGPMRITIGDHFVGLLMPNNEASGFPLTIHDDLRLQ